MAAFTPVISLQTVISHAQLLLRGYLLFYAGMESQQKACGAIWAAVPVGDIMEAKGAPVKTDKKGKN